MTLWGRFQYIFNYCWNTSWIKWEFTFSDIVLLFWCWRIFSLDAAGASFLSPFCCVSSWVAWCRFQQPSSPLPLAELHVENELIHKRQYLPKWCHSRDVSAERNSSVGWLFTSGKAGGDRKGPVARAPSSSMNYLLVLPCGPSLSRSLPWSQHRHVEKGKETWLLTIWKARCFNQSNHLIK